MIHRDDIKQLIEQGLSDAQAHVRGDDGSHFEADVVCPAFEGLSMVKQHQMVYATLGDRMQTGEIHALALRTLTPAEWQAQQQQ
jgi:acid stress-induced BolA-like protein IbaG/YrbA